MEKSIFDDFGANSFKTKKVDEKKEIFNKENVGKTQAIPMPEGKEKITRINFTINYLNKNTKEDFITLAKKMKISNNELLDYLVEKEWTKYSKS